jgi:5-oxopent-3-ene-1,2,5-tricarboxylate decarboxylase / 2-hydroxyhepta-2,4-diene-1,7-dioate isomerase
MTPFPLLPFEFAPYRLSGTVVTCLLNHKAQLAAVGEAVHQPPYKAPPNAPVLAIKPRNALAFDGAALELPPGDEALEIGASLGIVIGRSACCVARAQALDHVAGYTIVVDVGVLVSSHYRPAVRLKARDGFCPIGPRVVARNELANPDELDVVVTIAGQVAQRSSTGERQRGVAQLIADVSEFMTLHPGDVLTLGSSQGAPLARVGQSVVVAIAGLGQMNHRIVAAREAA